MVDLSLASYEEIIDELCTRFDCFVFCGKKPLEGTGEKITENIWDVHGDYLTALGLAGNLVYQVNKRWEEGDN